MSASESALCANDDCQGNLVDGVCEKCGMAAAGSTDISAKRAVLESVRSLMAAHPEAPSREDLQNAARQLQNVVPYNFEAWRLQADLLLNALHQLETRNLLPDPSFTLMAVPLRADDLRDAAEAALRQCARYADSEEKMIAIVDEANQVRRLTWF